MTDPRPAPSSAPLSTGGDGSAANELPAGTRRPLSAVEVLSFVCEIVAFIVLAVWGFVFWVFPWNIVAGIGTPVAAILLWALFVSPRAVFSVHPFVRAIVELLVYAGATAAFWAMGLTWVGVVYAVIAITVGAIAGRRRFT
ncbi:YrdB family protein [Microbacterium sp. cx-55]|nr:YrdB family protein [Microbacterium sp. cx-55]UGB35912.1 YrdB family protein [Microbacterium sp. cx-55]